jgi:hypothetical protein
MDDSKRKLTADFAELAEVTLPLHQQRRQLRQRWRWVALSWGTIGLWSLWESRHTIELLGEFFTIATIRQGLESDFLASAGLLFCLTLTIGAVCRQLLYWYQISQLRDRRS